MRFQNCVLLRFSQGCLNGRATNCASSLTVITHVVVKSVTFHCEYLADEGECRFYIFCITLYILDCYQIFTRFDLDFFIFPVMN